MQRSRRGLYPAVDCCTASLVTVGGGVAASLSTGTNSTIDTAATQLHRGGSTIEKATVGTDDIEDYAVTQEKLSMSVWKRIKNPGTQGSAGTGCALNVYIASASSVSVSAAFTQIQTENIPTTGSFLVSSSGYLSSSSAAQHILCNVTTSASAGSFTTQPSTIISIPNAALNTSYIGATGWITSSAGTTLTLQCRSVDLKGTALFGNPTLTALEVDSIS